MRTPRSSRRNAAFRHRRRTARVYRRRRRAALVVVSSLVALTYTLWSVSAVTPETVGRVDAPATAAQPKPPDKGSGAGALENELQRIAAGHPGFYGAAVSDPASGLEASMNPHATFEAASLGKLPVMLALYRTAAAGDVDLDEEITLLPSDVQDYGSGVLKDYPVGSTLTLRESAAYLMKESDNTAWVMLERYLGRAAVVAVLERLGAENLAYGGLSYGFQTSPADVVLLLKAVADPQFTSPELSEEMLDAMTDTAYEKRLPALLPENARVAHKIGSYDHTFSDAGVIFYKEGAEFERHYFIAVLGENTTEEAAQNAISRMALSTHRAITDLREN